MRASARGGDGVRDVWLALYVVVGALAGLAYVVLDVFSERRLQRGTLTGTFAGAHALIDHVFPIVVGGLLGVCAHYLRLRARLSAAEDAAARAEALRTRLQKVERDQAVWVLAAAVLHELNNPLQALVLLLDELAAVHDDASRRLELVARSRAQSERALSHLRTLRSMRAAGEPEFQRIALDRVLGAVADDVGPLAAEDGLVVRVECSAPVQASGDPTYVRTILENLIDNSLSSLRARSPSVTSGGDAPHARGAGGDGPAGRVTLRLDAEGGHAVVRVLDDGPPLDPSMRATLFEPLRTNKTRGLGLGLPIARALARAMRGDLSLEDAPAKTFRLELPLRDLP